VTRIRWNWYAGAYAPAYQFHLILVTSRQHSRCFIPQNVKSALEVGQNFFPKHVELIDIINEIIIVAFSWLFTLF